MTDIIRKDPLTSLFTSWPKWIDDFDMPVRNRGLKIHESEKDILIEAVVAGVPSKNVEVNIEDGVLTIKAEANEEQEEKNIHASSSYQYYYTAALSGGQWDKADASVKDGIVKIVIPKTEASRPRKINVKEG
jgi:HSP20 family protein